MKRGLALLAAVAFGLVACKGENEQTILKQTIINADSTYQLAALSSIPILENKIDGIHLTQQQINTLKNISQIIETELLSASQIVNNGGTLSKIAVNTIRLSVDSYVGCLKYIKEHKNMPSTCILDQKGN